MTLDIVVTSDPAVIALVRGEHLWVKIEPITKDTKTKERREQR